MRPRGLETKANSGRQTCPYLDNRPWVRCAAVAGGGLGRPERLETAIRSCGFSSTQLFPATQVRCRRSTLLSIRRDLFADDRPSERLIRRATLSLRGAHANHQPPSGLSIDARSVNAGGSRERNRCSGQDDSSNRIAGAVGQRSYVANSERAAKNAACSSCISGPGSTRPVLVRRPKMALS